jgi:hypothetical protein
MAEQEAKVSLLFKGIADGFQQVDSTSDISKAEGKLREVTEQIKDVKAYVPAKCMLSQDPRGNSP